MSRFARACVAPFVTAAICLTALGPAGAVPPPPSDSEWHEWRIVHRLNEARAAQRLGPVQRHSGADLIAQWSANVQAWVGELGHNANLAHDVGVAVTPDWRWAGENVGCGYDGDALHEMWLNSDGHRANMLRRDEDLVGVGAVYARGCLWATTVYIDT